MAYTAGELAKISGVTERTLRWYDTKGLLKPAYYGDNGYRYYEEEQLLLLQQILFFRELDFSLDEIRGIITGSDFDKERSLVVHKKSLQRSLERVKILIETVDRTLSHMRGKRMMEDDEMYRGFREWSKGKGPESFFLGYCEDPDALENEAEKVVLKSVIKQPSAKRDKLYYEELEKTYKKIYSAIAECIDKRLDPSSDEVQALIEKHHDFVGKFHECSKKVYMALAKLYLEKPEYKEQLRPFHPKFAEFISDAMTVFARKKYT